MNAAPLLELSERWREEAELLRRRGLEREARMAESYAEDLQRRISEWELEALSIAEAAKETGYSESHLRNLLSEERLENVGRPGAPRIRRADLPAKIGAGPSPRESGLVAEALRRRGS